MAAGFAPPACFHSLEPALTQDPIIEFDCPLCGKSIHSVGNHDWDDVRCPHCHRMVARPPANQHSYTPASAELDDLELEILEPLELEELVPDEENEDHEIDELFGIACHVCDTRIHVRNDQIGSTVQCPDCFTELTVGRPKPKKRKWKGVSEPENQSEQPKQYRDSEDGELRLEDEFERPRYGASYGLEPDEDVPPDHPIVDSGAPIIAGDDLPELAPLDDDELTEPQQEEPVDEASRVQAANETFESFEVPQPADIEEPSPSPATKSEPAERRLSRRERFEQAQRRMDDNAARGNDPFDLSDDDEAVDFPGFDQASMFNAIMQMLKSRGLWWRALAATAVMLLGALVKERLWPYGTQTSDFEGESGSFFVQAFLATVLGAAPYALGLAGLWLAASFVFRDAAMGRRQVQTWKTTGTNELLATFLIFGFSFFVAGVMGVFAGPLTIPLRVLVAPLFLLAAWYNRSFWSIASLDVFSDFQELSKQWGRCYSWLALLAVTGLLIGILFWLRRFIDSYIACAIITVIGVVLGNLVTLVFAAIAGWHAGKIVTYLNRS